MLDVGLFVLLFVLAVSAGSCWAYKFGYLAGKGDGWRQGWNDAMDINHRPVKKRKRWTLGPEGES